MVCLSTGSIASSSRWGDNGAFKELVQVRPSLESLFNKRLKDFMKQKNIVPIDQDRSYLEGDTE